MKISELTFLGHFFNRKNLSFNDNHNQILLKKLMLITLLFIAKKTKIICVLNDQGSYFLS